MSKNINQVFIANPITSNAATDLMYFGQSPYGVGNDAAMTYSNFSIQFASNVLTTKGDLYTFSTVNARLGVGTTNGQMLQVNSAATTGLAWSTATYPTIATGTGTILRANGTNWVASGSTFADTYGASTILYSNGANTVTGLTTANSSVLVTTSAGVPVQSGTMTNGQMIIGSTGATPVVGTISASGNLSVTLGAGTFALSLTGPASFAWNNVTISTQLLAVNQGYMTNDVSLLVTYTLPTTAVIGTVISIAGNSSNGWTIAQNSGQNIQVGSLSSTIGATGTVSSTNRYDQVDLLCVVANTTWVARSMVGNLTVV